MTCQFATGSDCGKLNSLARILAETISGGSGSTLIIEQTGIFPSSENPFLATVLRSTIGEQRSIIDAPAYLVGSDDQQICRATIQVCLINFWDFLLVSQDRQICFRGSHDEYGDLFGRNEGTFARIRAEISSFVGPL